jgi:hypothetical protein
MIKGDTELLQQVVATYEARINHLKAKIQFLKDALKV